MCLKESLTSADVLFHFDLKLPISLAGDASAYVIGAILSLFANKQLFGGCVRACVLVHGNRSWDNPAAAT